MIAHDAPAMDAILAAPPRLLAMIGLPFSGKSTASRALADALMADPIAVDDVMVKLRDGATEQDMWIARYRLAHRRIAENLARGAFVIFDAVNHRRHQRDRLRRIARDAGTGIRFLWIATPESVALDRLRRNRANPTRPDVPEDEFRLIAGEFEPPDAEADVLRYDGQVPLARWRDELADAMTIRDDLHTDGGLAFRRC
ncbi:MAG: ATP-binding protein [Thermomicrobiales bacterium]